MDGKQHMSRRARQKSALGRLRTDTRGFAGAEAALLALVLCGICIIVGSIVRRAALTAATALQAELAGTK